MTPVESALIVTILALAALFLVGAVAVVGGLVFAITRAIWRGDL